jgi:thiamine biosynthesis lipoprotein
VTDTTSVCYRTWKTELWLCVLGGSPGLRQWLDRLLHDEVDRLDLLASRFRADSELSRVNHNHGRWTEVSWEFVGVLTAGLEAADVTAGLVDPLLGRHVVAAGYDRWADQDSSAHGVPTAARWQAIEVRSGRAQARVRIPSDSALDLGAVAKGWLADRLAKICHASTGLDTLANMGGDLRVISPGTPWTVAADPDRPGIEPVTMDLRDAGMATSGLGHRSWHGGHHIIDPRTGIPARGCWSSVSVLAAEAAGANAAATAALVQGPEGPAWITSIGLDAWFVGDRQQVVGRWPQVPRPAPAHA